LPFGRLMGDILSLEFSLRMFLLKNAGNPQYSFPEWDKLPELKEGDSITLNAFTTDKYFSEVVERYNKDSRIENRGLAINDSLVDLRNALAHGLIYGLNPSPPFRLLHFERHRDKARREDIVSVKLNSLLTIQWFNEQIVQVRLAMENVEKAIKLLESNKL
ncbi:MAG: hypothetical protein V1850_03020, partial [Candidatus Bathyarchaeota archaeon]